MNDHTWEAAVPWGTGVLLMSNVVMYLVAGDAGGYGTLGDSGGREVPSVGRLVADVVRHDNAVRFVLTLLFLPVAVSLERMIGPVAVISAYVVGGFLAGLTELVGKVDDVPVAGATGGTTFVLTLWAALRWAGVQRTPGVAVCVLAWVAAHNFVAPDTMPWLGITAAGGVGAYFGVRIRRDVETS